MSKTEYTKWEPGTKLTERMDQIKVRGIRGKWHTLESKDWCPGGPTLWLLEEDDYGDEWPLTIVDDEGNLVLENCYNGWDDLEECTDEFIFTNNGIYRRVGFYLDV